MSTVKLPALQSLAAHIGCEIPELSGNVCPFPGPSKRTQYPYLYIKLAGMLEFEPQQERIQYEIGPTACVYEHGHHVGRIKLILGATSQYQRMELEEKVLNLFLSREGAPGVLLTDVVYCEKYNWQASWLLDGHMWDQGGITESRFNSEINVDAAIPALTTRDGLYSIDELKLVLDLDQVGDPVIGPSQTVLVIGEDGSLSLAE